MADKKIKAEDRMTSEQKLGAKISDFIIKNKNLLLLGLVALLVSVVVIICIATSSVSSKEKAMIRVSEYEDQLSDLVASGNDTTDYIANLQKEVKGKNYASQKAQYLIGLTYAYKDDFNKAYEEFMKCFKMNQTVYLGKLALLDAASCKDNLNDTDAALDLYNQVVGVDDIGLAPRALFNVGRIYYQKNDTTLAKATFQQIVDSYPESEYASIAKSIINQL